VFASEMCMQDVLLEEIFSKKGTLDDALIRTGCDCVLT
jgi:hypothetical protein